MELKTSPVVTEYTPVTKTALPQTRRLTDTQVGIDLTPNSDAAPESVPQAAILPRERSEVVCRVVNIVLALFALVMLAPLMLMVAALIKLTSRGPIMYSQVRVGLDRRRNSVRQNGVAPLYDRRMRNLGGSVFPIYKFRSMYVNAEATSGAVWASKGDPRVTPLGRVMRKCRIDELPQFFNVLLGHMNIVGPRPERPVIFEKLRENIPEYPLRQLAKPGITGWAQINHSYDMCVDDVRHKVRYDLEYIQRQSLAEDVRIMVKTLPVMIFQQGGW